MPILVRDWQLYSFRIPPPSPTQFFSIDPLYTNNTPILSKSTFLNTSFGFTTPGLIGTWRIRGTSETIDLVVGKPVPGPLPLFGAAAAYSWSRRLRRRIAAKV